jgi:hypothetical protein
MTAYLKTLALVFACSTGANALAQQVTTLDSLASLTFQHAETRKEISKALKDNGLNEKSVPCAATFQFDSSFGPLSGTVVGPYTCDFGPDHKRLFLESKSWVLVGTKKMDPEKQREALANAVSRVSPEQVFLYEVLLKSRWVRD